MKVQLLTKPSPSTEEMDQLLKRLNPPSSSAALRALQTAFPGVPIHVRVGACQLYAHSFLRSLLN